jgi:hypothetical protein
MLRITETRTVTHPVYGYLEQQFRIGDDAFMNAELCGRSAAAHTTFDPSRHSHWSWFIQWLLDEENYNSSRIREVIESPCKYRAEFIQYVLEQSLSDCRNDMFAGLFTDE